MHWWIPGVILAIAATALGVLKAREQPFIEVISLGIGLLTLLALLLWYVFLTGLRWRTRFLILLIVGGVIGASYGTIKYFTRVDGSIGGSGIPRLVWKWTPSRDAAIPQVRVPPTGPTGDARRFESEDTAWHYPQFLGPDRLAVLSGPALARDWVAHPPQPLWRQPIGLGWSSFAVQGRRAITQEQRQEQELVVGYDLLTGEVLWAHTNLVRFSESLGGAGPRATPTIRDNRVYAMGATGILDCLELTTGKRFWSRDVLGERQLGNIAWGKSCSPLWVHGRVVVTGGDQARDSLLAYDAETGEPQWQAGDDRASYASPIVGVLAGSEQILSINAGSITGHDAKGGAVLWSYAWPGETPKVTQPMVVDTNLVLIGAGYGLGSVLLNVDRSTNGAWSVRETWKSRQLKPKFTNLVRRGQHVFGLDEGILTCVRLSDGQRQWKDGRYGHGQLILVDDLLLVQAESGAVVLVEANPDAHRELTRFEAIRGKTWNNPVLVDDLLLVRNDQEAACYRLPLAHASVPQRR